MGKSNAEASDIDILHETPFKSTKSSCIQRRTEDTVHLQLDISNYGLLNSSTAVRQYSPCHLWRRRGCPVHGPNVNIHPFFSQSRLSTNARRYPLITLSTRAQVESKRADSGFLDAVKRIVAREGVNGLYSGLDSALFGISVTNFVYYYWYEWTRSFFEKAAVKAGRASKRLTTVESMIAGAIAGSATVMLTNPIWVVNTRMTTRKRAGGEEGVKAPTTVGTLLALIKDEGPLALFSGVAPALVLVINPILQYTIFEQLKNTLEKKKRITPTAAFLLGALGKLFATSITYPYITVKSRMHVAGRDSEKESMMDAMRRIIREEGYVGFYKGKLIVLMFPTRPKLTVLRYRSQSHSKCPHSRVPIRI